ncbi:MAG: dephospho-CoA kinase [Oscillospiraceae bacterium]|jgi:dephospho-CoA kinase|nr:dephospho-CoA kinase [Oscillospiraceae bacterium]
MHETPPHRRLLGKRPYVVALTGGIATGKSTAAAVLRALGAPVLDADAISRALTAPGGAAAEAVLARFGTLDRRALAAIVFTDERARGDLNAIVHPLVTDALRQGIAEAAAPVVVLDVPLLYEAGLDGLADEVWVTHVPEAEQIRRLHDRDGLEEAAARARINSQMPTAEKLRRADHGIDTIGAPEDTRACVKALYTQALKKAEP